MVFEHLWDVFNLKNFATNFIQLYQWSSHVAMGHFLGSIACVLGVVRLLDLANLMCGIRPILMGKVLY
jgi:hypothetical protein